MRFAFGSEAGEPSGERKGTPVPESSAEPVLEIAIGTLEPDPFQPRTEFKPRAIRELAESIEQHGILQPLLVRPMLGPNGAGRYWIVAGERRFRAAQSLGLETLPCRVRPYENVAAAVVALAENVHREDLNEIEKAEAVLRIKALTERTWEQIAELVKLSPDYVKRLAGLIKLAEPVRDLVRSGDIPARTAIALKPLSPRKQIELAQRVLAEGLTAEQIRELTRSEARRPRPARAPAPDGALREAAAQLQAAERDGPVSAALRGCAEAVAGIEEWIERRSWSPARVTPQQEAALSRLHERVALLHQRLVAIRVPIREAAVSDAEKLRRA